MWPGDQQPGGQQYPGPQQPPNQQWSGTPGQNPYQQPYQHPQYQQGQPPQGQPPQGKYPQGQYPQPWGGPGGPPPRRPNTKVMVAVAVAGALIVIGGAITAGVVLSGSGDSDSGAGRSPSPADVSQGPREASASPSETPDDPASQGSSTGSNDGSTGGLAGPDSDPSKKVEAVVHGWQPVPRKERMVAYDAPKAWEVNDEEVLIGFDDGKGHPTALMGGSSQYKPKWCGTDERALAGTKGADGAKDTADAARSAASSWADAAYVDEFGGGTVRMSRAKAFSDKHGVKGVEYTATITGVPGKKCASNGVVDAVAVKAPDGKYAVWVLVADTGVKDALPSATIDKMRGSLRFMSRS